MYSKNLRNVIARLRSIFGRGWVRRKWGCSHDEDDPRWSSQRVHGRSAFTLSKRHAYTRTRIEGDHTVGLTLSRLPCAPLPTSKRDRFSTGAYLRSMIYNSRVDLRNKMHGGIKGTKGSAVKRKRKILCQIGLLLFVDFF